MIGRTRDLMAGVGRVVITPPLGTAIPGGWYKRVSTTVHDELHVHALVLTQRDVQLVLVSCDLICLPGDVARTCGNELPHVRASHHSMS